jgi:hypothetical protein
MTMSTQPTSAWKQPPPVARAAIAVVAIAGVTVLFLAGITFFGLAVAFPIALPIAEELNLPVKAIDLEIARQLADVAWVFAAASVASFVGALAVVVVAIQRLSPVSDH